jgi:hypothetical protein
MAFSFLDMFKRDRQEPPPAAEPATDSSQPSLHENTAVLAGPAGGPLRGPQSPAEVALPFPIGKLPEKRPTNSGLQGLLPNQPSHGFTVRELLALIPPHLTRKDLPADTEVLLPLEQLAANMKHGRPSLLLSEIHAAYPRLFLRPMLPPGEDMEISLPYAKVVRLLQNAHQPASITPQPRLHNRSMEPTPAPKTTPSPFQISARTVLPEPQVRARAASPNPFAIAESLPGSEAQTSSTNPFSIQKKLSGFGAPMAFNTVESDVVLSPVAPVSERYEVEPVVELAMEPRHPAEASLTVSRLLSVCTVENLGFEPSRVPARVKVEIPAHLILESLKSDPPSITLAQMVAALPEKVQPAFERADKAMLLPIPRDEIEDFLPLPATLVQPAQRQPQQPLRSVSLFQAVEQEDAQRIAPPAAVLAQRAEIDSTEPSSRKPWESGSRTPPQGLEDLGDSYRAEELQESPPVAAKTAPASSPFVLAPSPPVLPPLILPSLSAAPQSPSLPVEAPVKQLQVAELSQEDLGFGYHSMPQQVMLRALFKTDRQLNFVEVLQLAAEQDGLEGAFFLTASGGIHSAGELSREVTERFAQTLPSAYRSICGLADAFETPREGSFTLRTDAGVRSFFLAKDHCLVVLHAKPTFSLGTRERLLILVQELVKLSE